MSAIARNQVFTAVHTVGGLLPADMLARISEGRDVPGCAPADYGVVGSRSVRDEAERHWDYLKSLWKDLRTHLPVAPPAEPPSDPTGRAVREWVEPLFAELGFGRLAAVAAPGITADDGTKTFPVSHHWRHVPVHVTAWHTDLDRRPAGAGAVPPQSLVQECLNRTSAHLWAVLTNGRQLRLLRDSSALATAAYVEFDLEAIFDGELFSEFVLLYRLLHATRFETADDEAPSACWLEKWRTHAIDSGTRALEQLRRGVQEAVTVLGTGFLRHPANTALRENLDAREFHTALLRLVYRMLFLFVAEDRDALHPPVPDDAPAEVKQAHEKARKRYEKYFSSARLRRHARRRRGTAHGDRYRALRLVLDALGDENGRPELALPALGGLFDHTDADTVLDGLELSNESLLGAVRHLAQVRDPKSRRWRTVDYRNLDAEELGSIYESLLELVPKYSASERVFELVELAGNTRKTTGSYYTPSSLIECLLDSALDPVVDEAVKRGEAKAAAAGEPDPADRIAAELLELKVCDPACGSGHFLVAAARRIAKKVAAVRERNPEPTLPAVRRALHEVVARCIYGVDLNPMAVELAKVSLWLEALEPGRPLGFLDAHIKHGNALIGATPALLRKGIPDKAFKPIEGDDPKHANALEKVNANERGDQLSFFDIDEDAVKVANTVFASRLRRITAAPADSLADVRRQEEEYRDWQKDAEYVQAKHIADAWCAAFMWKKTPDAPRPVTYSVFQALQDPEGAGASEATNAEIVRLREQYRFFHWHLEFPDVFPVPDDRRGVDERTGWSGGFDCVMGNPPWDKVDFEDKKYFATVEPSIAAIAGTARRTRIAEWIEENPEAGERYREARRTQKATFHFAAQSGSFERCADGLKVKGVNSLQTDHLFTERFAAIAAPEGRYAAIIPTTIATGAGAQHLFKEFTGRGAIRVLYGFENAKPLFPSVHSSYPFCMISLVGQGLHEPVTKLAFFLHDVEDLSKADRVFELSPEEIKLINPNTGTLPIFRKRRDAELTASVYKRIPVLWNEKKRDGNHWSIKFKNLFNMTDDSALFRSRESLENEGWTLEGNVFVRDGSRMLPLYEGKMVHHFDHRWNHFTGMETDDVRGLELSEKQSPDTAAMPRYWVPEADTPTGKTDRKGLPVMAAGVSTALDSLGWDRGWLYGWRDVARATDERTAIPAFIPRVGVGHTYPLMLPMQQPTLVAVLGAVQSSFVYDYISRQKSSGAHMALMTWKQLPVPRPEDLKPHTTFIVPRVLELVYTAYDMAPLARDLGDEGEPFRWDEERRAIIRAELDAYFFYLYGIDRDDVDYIMESFQTENGGLKNNEIRKYGTYRTKNLILEVYDRMADAGVSLDTPLIDGENFTSDLTPPPGHGPRHDPA
ncbi:N-6 DNA methylase [Thermobifida alba]|uniref:site-specific DNA-methyltransferase (adenine-specific) n=1 Tax=Thermobifida alba TaxID=53522 RepID=A0ABY4L141_THEAE|nr:DNA methyltransferase [Thermobifida alba]UPT20198.1 N-6 DNA methylase [Thermobifida alba]